MTAPSSAQVRAYRALVVLYPRSFRAEYQDLMVRVFEDDLTERGTRRAWSRTIHDLLVSIPIQIVEATVSKPSKTRLAQAGIALSILAVLAVVAVGRFVVIIVPLVVAIAAGALVYWRSTLPYRDAVTDASASWWKVILAGALLLGSIGAAATYGPSMDWFPWHLAALLYLAAWVAMIVGALLGLLHLARWTRSRAVGV